MTVLELRIRLSQWPDTYEVGLYEDEETSGVAVMNPAGKATTIEKVIELPDA